MQATARKTTRFRPAQSQEVADAAMLVVSGLLLVLALPAARKRFGVELVALLSFLFFRCSSAMRVLEIGDARECSAMLARFRFFLLYVVREEAFVVFWIFRRTFKKGLYFMAP